jgi:Na+/melibiose symporter-like transporter
MAALSQSSWGSVLSSNYNERTKIFAYWQVANIVGIIAIISIPVIVENMMGGSKRQSVEAMGLFIMALLPIMIGFALWKVPEKSSESPAHAIKITDYFMMFKRPNVVRVLLSDLWLGLAPGIMGALFFFYFMQSKGLSRQECNLAMLAYFIGGLVGAPIWNQMAKRTSKHQALIVSSLIFAVIYLAMYFVPKGNFMLSLIFVFMAGVPYAASLLLTRAMMADIGDEIILDTGNDHKGTLMAILSATTKLGYAFSVLTMSFLALIGFDNKLSQNSQESLFWLELIFIGFPFIFLLLGALALKSYDLTPIRHAIILSEIEKNRGQ